MTQTIGLKATTKHGEICIVFPFLKETEKAILIRVPQIAGSGYDIFATGREKEVWVPKSQIERGRKRLLSQALHLGEDRAKHRANDSGMGYGADGRGPGDNPGSRRMLGEVASKVREAV